VGFWDSRTVAVRVVPAAADVAFETDAAFVLLGALLLTAPRAGVDAAEAAFALLVVPVAEAGATAPLALPEGPLAAGGVSGA
jgi:hypothetical protein